MQIHGVVGFLGFSDSSIISITVFEPGACLWGGRWVRPSVVMFQTGGALRTIHDFDGFDRFIQDCFQEDAFYRYADPLADVIINMAVEGNGFPWHFDTNNFTVTLAIQNADGGGAFEYAPGIRKGSENFSEVGRVLDGTSDLIKVLELEPGVQRALFASSGDTPDWSHAAICRDFFLCGTTRHGWQP